MKSADQTAFAASYQRETLKRWFWRGQTADRDFFIDMALGNARLLSSRYLEVVTSDDGVLSISSDIDWLRGATGKQSAVFNLEDLAPYFFDGFDYRAARATDLDDIKGLQQSQPKSTSTRFIFTAKIE